MKYSTAVNAGALAFFAAYVLSNAVLLRSVPLFYFGKHAAVFGLAVMGIAWWFSRGEVRATRRYLAFFGMLILLGVPYLLRFVLTLNKAELLVFAQYAIFGIAVIALCTALERFGPGVVPRVVTLILLSTLGVVVFTAFLAPAHLYSSYWGRPRLLLGFWHPKEVGALITSAAFLVLTSAFLRRRVVLNIMLYAVLLVILLFVDSRNMFLFSLLFPVAYLSARYGTYLTLWAAVLGGVGVASWFVITYPVLADLVLSQRLSLWKSLDYSVVGQGTRLNTYDGSLLGKFNVDNFYLEYMVENGAYFAVLAIALVAILGYLVRCTEDRRWRRLKVSAAVAFFASAVFDAGMFSTGNFFHLTVWVYLVAGEDIFRSASAPVSVAEPAGERPRYGRAVALRPFALPAAS